MNYTAKKPEDILADNQNFVIRNGQTIRKGTMAAAIANAEIFESPEASEEQKLAALDAIQDLAQSLINFGFNRFLSWKNPKIQQIMDKYK